jgi:uncharacterized membrane-anchored protein YitT (DUF2179 family)
LHLGKGFTDNSVVGFIFGHDLSFAGTGLIRMMSHRCCCSKTVGVSILFFDSFWQVYAWIHVCMQKHYYTFFCIVIIPRNPRVYLTQAIMKRIKRDSL